MSGLTSLSDKALDRLWRRIIDRIYADRDLGIDEPTLYWYRPALYRAWTAVRDEIRVRTGNPKWGTTHVYG